MYVSLFSLKSVSFHQRTPLHIAVSGGYKDTVEYLIKQGADISIKDNDGVSKTTVICTADFSLSYVSSSQERTLYSLFMHVHILVHKT